MEEQKWCYLTHSWKDKRVHTFPKGISPKVNVITQLEIELIYYNVILQHVNPNIPGIASMQKSVERNKILKTVEKV